MASHATVHWSNSYSLYYSVCVYIYTYGQSRIWICLAAKVVKADSVIFNLCNIYDEYQELKKKIYKTKGGGAW